MANVTLDLLYAEIKQLHNEVHELKHALIPEEEISPAERAEIDALLADAKSGNVTSWRVALKK